MKKAIHILLIICLYLFISCTYDEECRKNRYVEMNVKFYKVTYNEVTKQYTTAPLTVDSLTVRGLRIDPNTGSETLVDSVLYNNKTTNTISLPLSKFDNESAFVLSFKKTIDTIRIFHTNNEQYLSLECGCITVHSIDTVLMTRHFLDSAKINVHNVNTTNAEHLRLYN
ncbi:MAG TPA: DUF6452 family protein [Paludibacter sp.]|nr:DUF6452 family protein [Paludibacter sp.]